MKLFLVSLAVAAASAASCGTFGCCAGSHFPALGPGGMGCAEFASCTGCAQVVEKLRSDVPDYEDWNLKQFANAPPCCQEMAKYIKKLNTLGFQAKLTPGTGCKGLTDQGCTKCNMLNFCAWNTETKECHETAKVAMTKRHEYTKTCNVKGNYVSVPLHEEAPLEGPADEFGFVHKDTVTEEQKTEKGLSAPIVTKNPMEWPTDFEGHLPAAGCRNVDFKKYPSGIPGCHYQFEALLGEGQFGNMDHGLPIDPRYPVETHVPQYPLGSHPELPDKVAQSGGDYNQQPQEHSPWVVPDFNRNGCLGGPCDPHFLQPILDGPVHYGSNGQ
mmetsp:Transcript_16477/g.32191  ORF Transcript_16477/g.32191 Transcript_16477/m.32191 type:complete len:328 (+) Transcript_16477:36-1019(+)|eukprot:CAMPEP_0175137140 /NCGR_PEP_ID=MMETSP0087-20121206/9654_1 /TAXON_ID=136419 /ORGANISM="Unknown Unknown, Strain D1" /LENGTH=327 /DNA_ID=CAMNT_0016419951 /DNA_START=242 /DNA_END=1225 /DNA_ORIENTATION=-